MDEGGRRLRISLQDLRPIEDAIDRLIEPEPLPPPPVSSSNGPLTVKFTDTLAAPMLEAEEAADSEEPTDFGRPPASGTFVEETVAGKRSAQDDGAAVIAERYKVEETIGEGGMGRVFRVRHLRLGKSFALKLMQTEFSEDSRARQSFLREARLASSLAHPNIVTVIDFGEDRRYGAFMVMELLEGEPLSSRMAKEGRFGLKSACDVILQVAEALDYMHKRQIVHCDIKTDNILLTALPPGGRRRHAVKLLDFGLARTDSPNGRKSAEIDGTPEYIAPERVMGSPPHPSMDIYSLGVLAYEIFTGHLPFEGKLGELLNLHVHAPPPPFSTHLKEPLDERAEALVMRALAKDPRDRQKDMAAFIYELRTLMDMLGFGRRRGGAVAQAPRVVADPRERRARLVHDAFDLSPLPMAGLNVDGVIVIANRAFNQFVTGNAAALLEGTDIHSTGFVAVHPTLSADMRKVHVSAESLQRVLHLTLNDQKPIRLMLWLMPGTAEAGEIQLTVHPLDA